MTLKSNSKFAKKSVNNKKCATKLNFFLSADFGVLSRDEFDLRVIFDQWPKLHLGSDVRPEIPILKGI